MATSYFKVVANSTKKETKKEKHEENGLLNVI